MMDEGPPRDREGLDLLKRVGFFFFSVSSILIWTWVCFLHTRIPKPYDAFSLGVHHMGTSSHWEHRARILKSECVRLTDLSKKVPNSEP